MKKLLAFALVALAAASASAQQNTARCAAGSGASTTAARFPGLIVGAECFGRTVVSASTSQVLRLRKTSEPATPQVVPRVIRAGYSNNPVAIASNFNRAAFLVSSWGNVAVAPSAAPDVVGPFRFTCSPGDVAWVDPIANPGTASSYLHQFFGNDDIQPNETYETLRTTGGSTCNNQLNRSGYWLPAMMNGRGKVVRPDYVTVYYKRRPKNDPICADPANLRYMGDCVDLPRGIRFIFGYDMATNTASTGAGYFNCQGPGARGHYPTIVAAAANCPAGAQLGAIISAPQCWDGVNLDSPTYRSHVAYASYGSWGYLKCPDTHPKVIPQFLQAAWYTTDDTLDRSGTWNGQLTSWHFSSDDMRAMDHGMVAPGTTFHADYWEGWDDEARAEWHRGCIDGMRNCSGGDLGMGRQLKQLT